MLLLSNFEIHHSDLKTFLLNLKGFLLNFKELLLNMKEFLLSSKTFLLSLKEFLVNSKQFLLNSKEFLLSKSLVCMRARLRAHVSASSYKYNNWQHLSLELSRFLHLEQLTPTLKLGSYETSWSFALLLDCTCFYPIE